MTRLLITGSRTWTTPIPVWDALDTWRHHAHAAGETFVVVHGACHRGVDAFTAAWCQRHRQDPLVVEEPHPADWRSHRRAAGVIRNHAMVALGADACIAFIRDHSPGASHCATSAAIAGIPVTVHQWGREGLR
ncbi:MAG: DUF2493 domain-containing protein [Streptosporangiales bacterium]|nr:DUF2493 domain-containing protein [Streptosporangiales bacterium]